MGADDAPRLDILLVDTVVLCALLSLGSRVCRYLRTHVMGGDGAV